MVNVVRIETAAMISGTSARNEANRNTRTASAPSAPSNVSTSRLGAPGSSVPWASRL